jgi:hypothetical protein
VHRVKEFDDHSLLQSVQQQDDIDDDGQFEDECVDTYTHTHKLFENSTTLRITNGNVRAWPHHCEHGKRARNIYTLLHDTKTYS